LIAIVSDACILANLLLESMEAWIEFRTQSTLHQFHLDVSKSMYDALSKVLEFDARGRSVDIGIIGMTGAWRVPHENSVNLALERLHRSAGKYDATLLAAAFVSTVLPRNSTMMTAALGSARSIVRPLSNAPWASARSYFSLATSLRHAGDNRPDSSSMLSVFESRNANVVLIFPSDDTQLREVLETRRDQIKSAFASSPISFDKVLEVVEGSSGVIETRDDESTRIFTVLAYENGELDREERQSWRRFIPKRKE